MGASVSSHRLAQRYPDIWDTLNEAALENELGNPEPKVVEPGMNNDDLLKTINDFKAGTEAAQTLFDRATRPKQAAVPEPQPEQ